MASLRVPTELLGALHDFLATFCLGLTVTSLVIGPLPAADLAKSSVLPSVTPQSWNEPLSP